MHILVTSTGFDPMLPERLGAIEPFVYRLSRELSNYSHVDVFAFGKGLEHHGNMRIQTFNYNREVLAILKSLIGYEQAYSLLFNVKMLGAAYRLHKSFPISIIHINNPYTTLAASILKSSLYVPVVISIHAPVRFAAPLRICDKVIAVSEFMKRYLILEKGLKPQSVDVLPVGVDVNLYKPSMDKEQAKEMLGLGRHNILLFVGRKCPEKGPKILIDALPRILRSCPNTVAVFIGADYRHASSSSFYTDVLRAQARKVGVADHVLFMMHIPEDRLRLYFNAADVFVMPSIWSEPFGTVNIEAMAYEKAVITTSVGGMPEYIENEKNGILVPPSSSVELADATISLLGDEQLLEFLGKNARETVIKRFSFEIVAKKCYNIYQSAIHN